MAEAVGLAASIIAVIQIADRIEAVCKFFIESVENCPRDLRLILIEASSVKAAFRNLEFIESHDPEASIFLKNLREPDGPIVGCLESIAELEKLIPRGLLPKTSESRSRNRTENFLAALAWPFKKDKARALLSDIAQYKATISTTLSAEIL